MLVSQEDSEVVSYSNQVPLNLKAHQSNTSKCQIPSPPASDPRQQAGSSIWGDSEDEPHLGTSRRPNTLGRRCV